MSNVDIKYFKIYTHTLEKNINKTVKKIKFSYYLVFQIFEF